MPSAEEMHINNPPVRYAATRGSVVDTQTRIAWHAGLTTAEAEHIAANYNRVQAARHAGCTRMCSKEHCYTCWR